MLANITTDLYLGADIAVDSLQNQGLNVTLKLFDTGRKNTKIDSILRATDFSQYDAIVGPLYSDELPKVANRTEIPVVFPVYSRNQSSFNFSRIVKTYPDKDEHQKELMNHILERYQNENVLIIGDSSRVSLRRASDIQAILNQHDSIKVQHDTIRPNAPQYRDRAPRLYPFVRLANHWGQIRHRRRRGTLPRHLPTCRQAIRGVENCRPTSCRVHH